MKANRAPRATARAARNARDDGVSSVLGGILFFALVVLVLVTIQTDFAPKWEEDAEAAHMNALRSQVASIKSEADRQAANATSQPVGLPLSLERTSTSRFLTSSTLPASVSYEPGVAGIHLEADELLVFVQGGQSLAGASEEWTEVGGSSIVADVADVDHLRLRLQDVAAEDHGDSVSITVTDKDGDFAGRLTSYIEVQHPDRFINTRVERADLDVVYDQGVSFHQVSGVNFWWIDALADELHFADVLAAADGPVTLTMTENGMVGQFTATYVEGTSGQTTGTAGKLLPDWSYDQSGGGTLSVEARNARFPSQTYRLQAGAVVLEQGDGRVFVAPPLFSASADGTTTRLSLTLPSLTGSAASAGGAHAATVVLDGGLATSLSGTAPHLTVQLNTTDADLWADHFRDRLETAGLSESSGEFELDETATQVRLTVYGRTTAPASTTHDLLVELHLAPIDVRIET